MTTYLFANEAATTLAAPCTSSATSVTLSSGAGALFPAPSSGQAFSLTMKDSATGEQTEIMYCTARTGDVCTVVRGQEGTTAQAWTTGDFAVNALTAGIAETFNQGGAFGTMAAQNANAVAITGGSINVTTLEVGGTPVLANPLTTKGDILVDNGTATVRLPVGTNGQVLTADSAQADGVAWEAPTVSLPLTTKGDLLVDTGGALARLPVGSNGQVLSADSTQTTGLAWEANSPTLPLTTKGDLLVDTGGALARLAVGTNGQVLAADSTQTSGLVWETNTPTLPLTTKGDLLIDSGSGLARLGVGSDGQVLTAKSSASDGVDWETPAAGGGAGIDVPVPSSNTLPQNVLRFSGNPVIALGGVGTFDAGSVRDCEVWYARNQLWMLYTGAASATTPYNPSIGIAGSTDGGLTWTKHGQVIAPNTTPAQWNSGGVFSPSVLYDEDTDILYVYVSGTQLPAQWYGGPIEIGVIEVAAAADWTLAASYTNYLNSGSPILTVTQSWEGAQGVYSPSVKKIDGIYVMLYSSSGVTGGVTYWYIGRAVASSPQGPFTKDTGNPVLGGGTTYAEEPSLQVLYGGTLVALVDTLSSASPPGPYGVGVWACSTNDGLGTWSSVGELLSTGAQTFDAGAIGSSAAALLPNGQFLIAYNGKPVGASTDARLIGVAQGQILLNTATNTATVNALIAAALAGGGGSADPYQLYVQFHLQPVAGPREFDTCPRKRTMILGGAISNSGSNVLFNPVNLHSVAGSGFVSIPANPEYNIPAAQDFTLEVWVSFTNAATAIEMITEIGDTGGLAFYRDASGHLAVAQSRTALIHTGTAVIGAGGWHLVVAQRQSGTFTFLIGAAGSTFMAVDATFAGDTTLYTSTNPPTIMAAAGGTASFMNGDIAELRYTPGVSRGYTSATLVPTAPFPN